MWLYYQPPHTDEGEAGEIDVLACLEGVLLLLEVKSGFIRSNGHEVWLHRTNTLRKAARQLKRKALRCSQPCWRTLTCVTHWGWRFPIRCHTCTLGL